MGYETPTPIQTQSIPELLKGRDMLAAAQTGTGKTAAFALPILAQMLARPEKRTPKAVRALVLAPTRELAAQIDENIRAYAARTDLKTALVFGGVNIKPQTAALAKGVDFLVATPGRLLDHLGQKNVTLENVGFLVLDEADRMLDMGFIHDIRKILKFLPVKRQTLLFSATFSDEIKALADTFLTDPLTVEIARNKESTLIHQEALAIAKKRKRELLRDLIVDNAWDQVLVFTRMKHTANRLAQQLEKDGITAAAIHGNQSQSARTIALAGFKNHTIRVLVATDIAARGLDIEGLPHVVNFELPEVAEDYVHRIGRTGRAGMEGHAVSLVAPEERDLLRAIEKLLKRRIDLTKAEGYDGEVPEDIARDNAERDKARAEELARLRESRRRPRERNGEAPRKKARASEALLKKASHAETTENPEERFVKKVVRKAQAVKENRGQEAQATRNAAPELPTQTAAAPAMTGVIALSATTTISATAKTGSPAAGAAPPAGRAILLNRAVRRFHCRSACPKRMSAAQGASPAKMTTVTAKETSGAANRKAPTARAVTASPTSFPPSCVKTMTVAAAATRPQPAAMIRATSR